MLKICSFLFFAYYRMNSRQVGSLKIIRNSCFSVKKKKSQDFSTENNNSKEMRQRETEGRMDNVWRSSVNLRGAASTEKGILLRIWGSSMLI